MQPSPPPLGARNTMAVSVSEDGMSEYLPNAENAFHQLEDNHHHIGARKRQRKESNAKENNDQQRESARLRRKHGEPVSMSWML